MMCNKRMKGKKWKTGESSHVGLEMVMALRKRQETELTMFRFCLGEMKMDRIRNESVRGTAQVRCFENKCREGD